jgi:hypothetical protein
MKTGATHGADGFGRGAGGSWYWFRFERDLGIGVGSFPLLHRPLQTTEMTEMKVPVAAQS